VVGDQALHGGLGAWAAQVDLAHVRDVEEPDRGADLLVLLDDAAAVLQRHLPAAEVDELGAELGVRAVKRGAKEVGQGRAILVPRATTGNPRRSISCPARCRRGGTGYPWPWFAAPPSSRSLSRSRAAARQSSRLARSSCSPCRSSSSSGS